MKASHLPDWFYEQVCDYAENLSLDRRKEVIGQFCGFFGELCVQNEDILTISPKVRETYFRKSYARFTAAANELTQSNYETFSGIRGFPILSRTLDILNTSFEDRRGIYIYLRESGELITLDYWIRTADFSKPFYIGGTINYHC